MWTVRGKKTEAQSHLPWSNQMYLLKYVRCDCPTGVTPSSPDRPLYAWQSTWEPRGNHPLSSNQKSYHSHHSQVAHRVLIPLAWENEERWDDFSQWLYCTCYWDKGTSFHWAWANLLYPTSCNYTVRCLDSCNTGLIHSPYSLSLPSLPHH